MFIISKEQEYNYLTRHCSLATNIQIYEATHNQRVSSYNYNF